MRRKFEERKCIWKCDVIHPTKRLEQLKFAYYDEKQV